MREEYGNVVAGIDRPSDRCGNGGHETRVSTMSFPVGSGVANRSILYVYIHTHIIHIYTFTFTYAQYA